jgi:integrase
MRVPVSGVRQVVPHFGIKRGAAIAFYVGMRSPTTGKWIERHIGDYPTISLADARNKARAIIEAIVEDKLLPVSRAEQPSTFSGVVETYKKACLADKRSRREIEAALDRASAIFGRRAATSLRHEDIVSFLKAIAAQTERNHTGFRLAAGGPHAAKKIKASLSAMFKWAAFNRIGGVTTNPVSAIPNTELHRGKVYNKTREHVIADADLRVIWKAAEPFPYPFGKLIQALLLSGQRLNELACARRSEIDEDTDCLVIPAERMKNNQVHALPIDPTHARAAGRAAAVC